jgi:hypothetical protein
MGKSKCEDVFNESARAYSIYHALLHTILNMIVVSTYTSD